MFLVLIPRIAINLEFHLLDLNTDDDKVREIINNILKDVCKDKVFLTDFSELNIEDFKHLSYTQANAFKKIFFSNTINLAIDDEALDKVFLTILKEAIELVYRLDPNSQGIENALIQARREYRGNTWLVEYDSYRNITETVLLNLEKMTNSQIPALLFYFAKALELVINEIQEMRSKGIITLVYVDSEFIELKRGQDYPNIVATLTLDQASRTATLKFLKDSNLLARRSAQRLAHTVVKFGFELPDLRRVGLNFILEVLGESEFA